MYYIFYNFSSLLPLTDIYKWNTNNVKNMSYMFSGCSSLKELPENISNWNISNVKYMGSMFENCSSLGNKDKNIFNYKFKHKKDNNNDTQIDDKDKSSCFESCCFFKCCFFKCCC